MVCIYIQFDKSNFKSKNALTKLKSDVRKMYESGINVESFSEYFSCDKYLNLENIDTKSDSIMSFLFSKFVNNNEDSISIKLIQTIKEEDMNPMDSIEKDLKNFRLNETNDNIYLQSKQKEENRRKFKERLEELRNRRTGLKEKEIRSAKKNVDKNLFKKFEFLKSNFDAPIEAPLELLENKDKYKEQIQIFASGFMELTKNDKINNLIIDYYRQISKKLDLNLLNESEFKSKVGLV